MYAVCWPCGSTLSAVDTRRYGADINKQNADGDTAAHLAATLHNLNLLTVLLQARGQIPAHPCQCSHDRHKACSMLAWRSALKC